MQTATTTTKPNLFAVKAASTAKPASKSDKLSVVVTEEDHPNLSDKLKRLAELKTLMDEYEAESKSLEFDIKQEGQSQFLKLYKAKRFNPGSFVLKGEHGGQFMIIVMDRYLSIDETRAEELKSQYGPQFVSTTTSYKFNSDLLEKHMEAINECLVSCESIPDEDKAALIVPDVKHSVAKGSIDMLMQVEGDKVEELFTNIQPITQLKNSK